MTAKPTVLAPPNTLPRIETIWAYLSIDEDGNEGVCAGIFAGQIVPFVAADRARLTSLTEAAEKIAAHSGMRIVLAEFTGRTDLRTITGKSDG